MFAVAEATEWAVPAGVLGTVVAAVEREETAEAVGSFAPVEID